MAYIENAYVEEEVLRLLPLQHISGIAPNDPKNVSIFMENGSAFIGFEVPDTIIEGQRLCTVGGAIILRKLGSPPASKTDGVVIGRYDRETIEQSSMIPIVDRNLFSDVDYYYWLVPFSDHGVFNYRIKNIYTTSQVDNSLLYREYNITSLPFFVEDPDITSDMVVAQAEISTPQDSSWHVSTEDGAITISGDLLNDEAVTIGLLLAKNTSSSVVNKTLTVSSLPFEIEDSDIKSTMVVAESVVTSGNIVTPVKVITYDGRLRLEGVDSGAFTLNLTLIRPNFVNILEREYVIGALPYEVTDEALTSKMRVINYGFSDYTAQRSSWKVITADGGLTITGSIDGGTRLHLLLGEPVETEEQQEGE